MVENWRQISACFGLMLVAKNLAFPNFLSKEGYNVFGRILRFMLADY